MNEQKLIEKLRLIEALFLFSGTTTKGEKVAAEMARERKAADRKRRSKRKVKKYVNSTIPIDALRRKDNGS